MPELRRSEATEGIGLKTSRLCHRCVIAHQMFLLLSRRQATYRAGSPACRVICNQPPCYLHPAMVRTIKEASSSASLAPKVSTEDVDLAAVEPDCSPHVQTRTKRQDATR